MLQETAQTLSADSPAWPETFRARYVREGFWQAQTFSGMLDRAAGRHPGKTALIEGERHVTYQDLGRRAGALAAGLRRLGLEKGDRAVVQMPNSIAFVEIVFALLRLGVVPVLALPSHRHLEIGRFLDFTEARAYFVADRAGGFDYRALARDLLPSLPALRHVIVDGEADAFTALSGLFDDATVEDVARPEDVAVFQISGGTTGVPKLIPRRHTEYLYNIRTAAAASGMGEDTVYLCALPAAHNFPFACPGIMGTFVSGGTAVIAPDPDPKTAFSLIAKHGVTITSVVPPLALLWMDAIGTVDADISSLRTLQVGGAKLSEEAARRVRPRLGCGLQQVFGMAEGLICYTGLDDDEETIVTTQGKPMSPADEIRVVDAEGRDVASGEPGELLTRGPYTIRGYYKIPEHNEKAFTSDGFYRTGDIVRLTPAGYMILSGREKDQINRGGEKLSPEEIENLLLAHEAVHDAAVVGLPDETLGERTCAFVIAKSEGLKSLALVRHLKARGLAAFKMPDQFVFIAHFPETGIGKVSKKDLRERLKQLHLSAGPDNGV